MKRIHRTQKSDEMASDGQHRESISVDGFQFRRKVRATTTATEKELKPTRKTRETVPREDTLPTEKCNRRENVAEHDATSSSLGYRDGRIGPKPGKEIEKSWSSRKRSRQLFQEIDPNQPEEIRLKALLERILKDEYAR